MRSVVLLSLCAVILAGCNARKDQLAFDGQYFRSSVARVDKDRQQMVISVKPVSASFEGALEAGRHEATKYCVLNFGSSAIDWILGPDEEADAYTIQNDTLTLRGTCEG